MNLEEFKKEMDMMIKFDRSLKPKILSKNMALVPPALKRVRGQENKEDKNDRD